jgi:hypothetical protein
VRVVRTRLVSVTPLCAGWRGIYACGSVDGELATLGDSELYYVLALAALATVEIEYDDGDTDTEIRPLSSGAEGLTAWYDDPDHIGLLGPGEDLEPWVRAEAIRVIESERKKRASRLEKAA